MAVSIYKWFSLSLLGFVTGFLPGRTAGILQSGTVNSSQHPFHVSVAEINHNAKDKIFEISCRIFVDDFESALYNNYKTKIDLQATDKTAMNKLVKDYILQHLQVKADDKIAPLIYLGYEVESESVYVYLEADKISSVKKIAVTDTVLFDLYKDQISIIHAIVGGNRKSMKLDYPDKQAVFNF
jgi:hypothetical protein